MRLLRWLRCVTLHSYLLPDAIIEITPQGPMIVEFVCKTCGRRTIP